MLPSHVAAEHNTVSGKINRKTAPVTVSERCENAESVLTRHNRPQLKVEREERYARTISPIAGSYLGRITRIGGLSKGYTR
jgi:hypothetical protein